MKLSRVEIHGFKSFAQRTELNFDKGITGIVGPNGSGKSNIADAVRWVLGEQSAKILRGSKMEDVIFNGTQTRKPLPYCEVSLQFDNEDRALNSPYSEVLVTRRVYRNGEGEYFLNRSNCRLRDILELFRDTGIGKEGYSIIGQGRIEEILSTKGEERREVFEEAAGIVTFRVRKEQAERKLDKTRENLNRVNDIIDEISARIEPLASQAKTAQEFLSLSKHLRQLEVDSYLIRHDKLYKRLSSLKELTDGLEAAIQSHDIQLKELTQLRISQESMLELLEEQDKEAKDAFNQAQENRHNSEQEIQTHQNKLAALALEVLRLAEQLKEDEDSIIDLRLLFSQNENERLARLEQQKDAEIKLKLDEEHLAALLHEADEAEENLDIHKGKIITALTQMSDAKSMQARQQTMLTQMQERIKEIIQQKDSM
ncbi:MAG: AAA family ATPase, partial [Clostridiales bacterium]|nr:AAA family ATPase [Clostridiales bacterium]